MDGSTMRVDAAASMAKILGAARRAFSLGDGSGPLNRIAKEAGVGIATLYRHFPNRESLALAVYDDVFATEVQPVFAQFARTDAPRDVLLALGERLLGVLDRERGLVRSLSNLAEATRELMGRNAAAIEQTVRRAQAAGTLRADITPEDIPNLMTMIAAGFGSIPSGAHRRRYLSLVLDSLNPAQAHPLPSV